MSGRVLFSKYNNFSMTVWKISFLILSRFSSFLFIINKCLADGELTLQFISSPKASIVCYVWFFIEISKILSLLILIFIPKNWCVSPLTNTISPKWHDIYSITSITKFFSTWIILLSSTCYAIVNCFPLIILFSMHWSFLLMIKPILSNLFLCKSHQSIAASMHP